MANGRCRMHGGKSPGAPLGNQNALKHGRYTAEAKAEHRVLRELLRSCKETLERVGNGSQVVLLSACCVYISLRIFWGFQ